MVKIPGVIEIPRWMEVMAYIFRNDGDNLSKIHIRLNITYSHVSRLVQALVDLKMIRKKKIGRQSIVTLTEKGRVMAECCYVINKKLYGGRNDKI